MRSISLSFDVAVEYIVMKCELLHGSLHHSFLSISVVVAREVSVRS